MAQYTYTPLRHDRGRNEIRLVRLLPGPASADLEAEIIQAYMSPHLQYEALSYVWGSPTRQERIFVRCRQRRRHSYRKWLNRHAKWLPVTKSILDALHHLRDTQDARTLWIDAISINQDDVSERSQEVNKMGNIYSNASNVVVWLGPSSHNSSLAVETLKSIGRDIEWSDGDWKLKIKIDTRTDQIHNDNLTLRDGAVMDCDQRIDHSRMVYSAVDISRNRAC